MNHLPKALLAVLVLGLSSCADVLMPEKPRVESAKVKVLNVNMERIKFRVALKVNNPNNLGLRCGQVGYGLDLAEVPAFEGSTAGDFKFAASSVSTIPLVFEVPFASVPQIAKAVFQGGDLPYRVHGSLGLSGLLSGITIPFSHSGTVPLPEKGTVNKVLDALR